MSDEQLQQSLMLFIRINGLQKKKLDKWCNIFTICAECDYFEELN